ncbi:MAG: ATP-binding protein [Pseudoflavonifractor sp.]
MLRKVSLRLRLTMISVLLLTLCCVGLTAILNLSAGHMASVIEATAVTPAQQIKYEEVPAADLVTSTPAEGTQAARDQFLYQSIWGMVLVVVLGGVLTYFISAESLKPVRELSEQMKGRTVHNLAEELPVPASNDEIADLTRSFNHMSAKLEDAFAMQRRFSQSAAHELRTPLTVLKTKVEVFSKSERHSPQEYDRLLCVVTAQTNRLADLVTDLLTLTNMDALDCDACLPLETVLAEVTEELSGLAEERGITITVEGGGQTVCGNRSLLHRAFYNLVENAIRYNAEGGRVILRLTAVGGRRVVTVADTGMGIPPEAQELIFEPFYRVDKSRSRQAGGAGLGLAMVKRIVEQHGGTITVGDNEGGGTVFEVVL